MPQSLVASHCDVRQRTGSIVITHFTMGKVDKKCKHNVQVAIASSPFELCCVPRLLEHSAG